ncbi:MAG: redoxin domain-containing protein [Candidatus Aminicenantes bacterium]|nr:redoxin domain-containing protein [Candidatus Aminicenantes bacterium]
MKRTTKIAAALLILLFTHGLALAVLKKGNKLLAFSLMSIEDKKITVKLEENRLTLIEEFMKDGKTIVEKSYPDAVMLDFWATWCLPCRAAMPYMDKLYEKYRAKEGQAKGGLELLGIAIDTRGARVVKPFFKRATISYRMLADPTTGSDDEGLIRTTKKMKSRYKVQEIPVVFLIDAKGTIDHVHIGFTKKDITGLENAIKETIQGGKE